MFPDPIFGSVHMYGVMISIGLMFSFLVLFKYSKKKKIEDKFVDFIFYLGVVSIILGFGSGMLFQALYNYIEDPSVSFFKRIGEGMTFLGGLIGGAVVFLVLYFIFRKKYKARLCDIISIIPCCILVGHAFGRIGCFCAGCCYGKEASGFFSFLGVSFPKDSLYWGYDGTPVYPTQLFESAFLFIMFGVTSYLVLKKDFKHNLSLYFISYGIFRFLLEYVRDDHRGKFMGGLISPSQVQSLVMIAIGIGVIFFHRYILKKRALELEKAGASSESSKAEDNKVDNNEENSSVEVATLTENKIEENGLKEENDEKIISNSAETTEVNWDKSDKEEELKK